MVRRTISAVIASVRVGARQLMNERAVELAEMQHVASCIFDEMLRKWTLREDVKCAAELDSFLVLKARALSVRVENGLEFAQR